MKIYNATESAKFLEVSRQYIYLLYYMGKIKPIKNKPLLFTEEELLKIKPLLKKKDDKIKNKDTK